MGDPPASGSCPIVDTVRRGEMVNLYSSMTTTSLHTPAETLDGIADAVLSTDLDGRITYLNPAAEAMTGWSRTAAAGQPSSRVLHIVDRDTRVVVRDPMALAVELNRTVGLTPNCVLIRRDGEELAIEDSAAPIRDRDGRIVGAVIVFRDVGAALDSSRRMAHLAQHDAVTGLLNRLPLENRMTEAIALARRHARPLAVLFADVDGFKNLNDSFGHAAGDQVLREMGARFQNTLRRSDTVCRYGGDEFVLVLAELERNEDAALVARKLLRVVAEPYRVGSVEISLTVSIGISLFPCHGNQADTLIARADTAMYEAKRRGPGSVRVFDLDAPMRDCRGERIDGRGVITACESDGRDRPPVHAGAA